MRRLLAAPALLLSVTLLMAACGDDDDDSTSVAPAASPTTEAAATATTTATTASAAAGDATTTAVGGYDYGGGSATATTAASASPTTAAAATATTAAGAAGAAAGQLALADTSAGKVIVDGEGRTLYLFVPDGQGDPTCYDSCEQTWPFSEQAGGVGAGLDASKLGTTMRTGGEAQATYNGWPLYRFAGDSKSGDVNGIGIGGNWFAVDAAGNQVDK
jgi:predicted lipoprotein with Yx(FWY)xxD motif